MAMAEKPKSKIHIAWTTISYRSVLFLAAALLVLLCVGLYFLFPNASRNGMEAAGNLLGKLVEKLGSADTSKARLNASGPQQAKFTNIDGTVRVKKGNSNSWVTADYSVPLEKGDVVQTSSEGMAKVVFADGTNYTIKQDSLIVIEENSTNDAQQTQVAVQVTTGTVDLTTATYTQGSKSQVSVAGATASLAPDSSAMVHNDPRADQHEILVKKGSGEVTRNGEVVRLTDFEKVSFQGDSKQMDKVKETGPPTLISPANMMPIFVSGGEVLPVEFTWTPMPNTRAYRMRISRNPYFSSSIFDKKVQGTVTRVPGLGEGAYYWMVQSIGLNNRESVESERNRFTLIPKGSGEIAMLLEVEAFTQHGHVIEVKGKTEPSARVMVNGAEVPVISGDGTFRYFTPPLPNGESVITVTAQNAKGGVRTQQKKVVIQD